MNPEFTKSLASLLVGVMSFLGWNVSDYANLLPAQIKSHIQIQNTSSSTPPQKNIKKDTELNKKIETSKSVPKPKKIIPVTPQVIIPKEPIQKIENKIETRQETKPETKNYSVPTFNTPTPPIVTTSSTQKSEPETKTSSSNSLSLTPEEKIKKSTINILCSRVLSGMIQKTTGSGVVIDPQGIILTNAHVAEHILLEEAGHETCFVRTGSPAQNSYKAKIIYLPDVWIQNNKNNLSIQNVTGNGENDYALLILTERVSVNADNIPVPYLSLSTTNPSEGQNIILAGYPANFGDASLLDTALYQLQKSSNINHVMSFDGSSIGAINTKPTVLAEHGSSGGAMVSTDGVLLGIMVATTIDSYSGQKNIQGITLPYIRKSIQQNSGKSFDYFLTNAQEESNNFQKEKVNNLSKILLEN